MLLIRQQARTRSMLHLVEVRLYGDELAAFMNSARTCLDQMFHVTLAPERPSCRFICSLEGSKGMKPLVNVVGFLGIILGLASHLEAQTANPPNASAPSINMPEPS